MKQHEKFKIFVESLRDESNEATINAVLEGYDAVLQEGLFDMFGGGSKAIEDAVKAVALKPLAYLQLPPKLQLNNIVAEKFINATNALLVPMITGAWDFRDGDSTNKHKIDATPSWIKNTTSYNNKMALFSQLKDGLFIIDKAIRNNELKLTPNADNTRKDFNKQMQLVSDMKAFYDAESGNRNIAQNMHAITANTQTEPNRVVSPQKPQNASQLRSSEQQWVGNKPVNAGPGLDELRNTFKQNRESHN